MVSGANLLSQVGSHVNCFGLQQRNACRCGGVVACAFARYACGGNSILCGGMITQQIVVWFLHCMGRAFYQSRGLLAM